MIAYRVQNLELRNLEEYEQMGQEHNYRYVNYQVFLESLAKRIEP